MDTKIHPANLPAGEGLTKDQDSDKNTFVPADQVVVDKGDIHIEESKLDYELDVDQLLPDEMPAPAHEVQGMRRGQEARAQWVDIETGTRAVVGYCARSQDTNNQNNSQWVETHDITYQFNQNRLFNFESTPMNTDIVEKYFQVDGNKVFYQSYDQFIMLDAEQRQVYNSRQSVFCAMYRNGKIYVASKLIKNESCDIVRYNLDYLPPIQGLFDQENSQIVVKLKIDYDEKNHTETPYGHEYADHYDHFQQFDFLDDNTIIALLQSSTRKDSQQEPKRWVNIYRCKSDQPEEIWNLIAEKVIELPLFNGEFFFKAIGGIAHLFAEQEKSGKWYHFVINSDGKSNVLGTYDDYPMPFSFQNHLLLCIKSEQNEKIEVYDKDQLVKELKFDDKPDAFGRLNSIKQAERNMSSIHHTGIIQLQFQDGYAEMDPTFKITYSSEQPYNYLIITLRDYFLYEDIINSYAEHYLHQRNVTKHELKELHKTPPKSMNSDSTGKILCILSQQDELLCLKEQKSQKLPQVISQKFDHKGRLLIEQVENGIHYWVLNDGEKDFYMIPKKVKECLSPIKGEWHDLTYIETIEKFIARSDTNQLHLLRTSFEEQWPNPVQSEFLPLVEKYFVSPCEQIIVLVNKSKLAFCQLFKEQNTSYNEQSAYYKEIQHVDVQVNILDVQFMENSELVIIFYENGAYDIKNIYTNPLQGSISIECEQSPVDPDKIKGRANTLYDGRIIVYNNQIIDLDYKKAAQVDFNLSENKEVFFSYVEGKLLACQPEAEDHKIKIKDLSCFVLIHFTEGHSQVILNDDFDKLTALLGNQKALTPSRLIELLKVRDDVLDVILFPERWNILQYAFAQKDTEMLNKFLDRGTLTCKSIGSSLLSYINLEGNIQDKANFMKQISQHDGQKMSFHKYTQLKDVVDTNCNQTAQALQECMTTLERKQIYCKLTDNELDEKYYNQDERKKKYFDAKQVPPYSSPNDVKVTWISNSDNIQSEVETINTLNFYTKKRFEQTKRSFEDAGIKFLVGFGALLCCGYLVVIVFLGIFAFNNPDPSQSYWAEGLDLPETTPQKVVDKLVGTENEIQLDEVINVHSKYITFFVWAFWSLLFPCMLCCCTTCSGITLQICGCSNITEILIQFSACAFCACVVQSIVLFVFGIIWRWGDMGITATTYGLIREPVWTNKKWEDYQEEMILQHGLQLNSGILINVVLAIFFVIIVFFSIWLGFILVSEYIKNRDRKQDLLPVQFQKCEIRIPASNTKESVELKESLHDSLMSEIFSTTVITSYVGYEFDRIFFAAFFQSLLWAVLLGFLILQFWRTDLNKWWTQEKQKQYTWIPFTIACLGLIYECIQFMVEGKKYFKKTNYADVITLITIITVLRMQQSESYEVGQKFYDGMVQLMFLMLWMIIIFKYLTIFGPLRFFIKMVTETLASILTFIVVLGMFIFAYAHSLSLYYPDKGYQEIAMSAYVLGFGELDENFASLRYMNTFIFIFYTVIITVQLLNLLIALLSDKYEEVMEKKPEFMARAMLEKCLEFENMRMFFKSKKKEQNSQTEYSYMYIKCKVSEVDDMDSGIEWIGMFGKLSRQIRSLKHYIVNSQEKQSKTINQIMKLTEVKNEGT